MDTLFGIDTDVLEAAAGIATAVGAVAAAGGAALTAYFAFRGLKTWRDEMLGRRKAELAEVVLADVYRLRDILDWVRNPGSFGSEGQTRERGENEKEETARIRDGYFVPIERLQKEEEFLVQFEARRYRFMALFSSEAAKPYEALRSIVRDIQTASQALLRETYWAERRSGEMDQAAQDRMQRYEDVIWRGAEDDEIPQTIEDSITALEMTCRKAIEGREK